MIKMKDKNLENDIKWIGTYLDRYTFDFKSVLPDERKLLDGDFNTLFCNKEELDNTLWIIEHQGGMYNSRGDLDLLLKKIKSSIDIKSEISEKFNKVCHMDDLMIILLEKISIQDNRFKIYLNYWNEFKKTTSAV